ncbi:protein Dr1-like isoform X1 [Halichondria panicea]|uniref:protein Dr1-like isoform X1 n=1 Tax=Halichondria panicea TaxID=6063 RepID=UPI00312B685C
MADGGSGLQDDELYLPRTVVNKLIKEIVPNIRVSTDARDLLLNCCTEFIHLIASEASDISEKQAKKVISPEHVVEALSTLGFTEYVVDVKAVHKEYKEQASKHRRRGRSKLDKLGIPEEELHRQQQQLFEEARQQQMESEMLEQQRLQQTGLPSPASSGNSMGGQSLDSRVTVTPSPQPPSVIAPVSVDPQPATLRAPSVSTGGMSLLPQGSAITVASLQATSHLIQQALAMASAQMATGQLLHQGLAIPPQLAPPTGATLPILLPKPPQLLTTPDRTLPPTPLQDTKTELKKPPDN